jgi:hypothetical protein
LSPIWTEPHFLGITSELAVIQPEFPGRHLLFVFTRLIFSG